MLGAVLLGASKGFLGGQQLLDNAVVMGVLLIVVVLFLPNGVLPELHSGLDCLSKSSVACSCLGGKA